MPFNSMYVNAVFVHAVESTRDESAGATASSANNNNDNNDNNNNNNNNNKDDGENGILNFLKQPLIFTKHDHTVGELILYLCLMGGLFLYMIHREPPRKRRSKQQRRGTTIFFPDATKKK